MYILYLLNNGFRRTSKGFWIANGLDSDTEDENDETVDIQNDAVYEMNENISDDDGNDNSNVDVVPKIVWPNGISGFKDALDSGIFCHENSSQAYIDEDSDTSQSSFIEE